jgi:uncharacterized BrkB/YihY/UPF0761 family membrane protein
MSGWRGRVDDIVRRLAADSAEHHLWTYGSAISFRALVALVPLALLGTSAAIFLVGVQLDELLRKDVRGAK